MFAVAALLALTACGGGGGGSTVATTLAPVPVVPDPTPTASSTSTPAPGASPTASPSEVAVSPTSLSFASLSSPAQTVTVSQTHNSAGFTFSTTTCKNIAGVATPTGFGPFSFTALGAGSCTYTVTGVNGLKAAVTIVVTTTGVTVQSSQSALH